MSKITCKKQVSITPYLSLPLSLPHFCILKYLNHRNRLFTIGRAGRDGKPAHCYMFTSKDDLYTNASLSQQSLLPLLPIYTLLSHIFLLYEKLTIPVTVEGDLRKSTKRLIALNIQQLEQTLNMSSKCILSVYNHCSQYCYR